MRPDQVVRRSPRERFEDAKQGWTGAHALYRERPSIATVRIAEMTGDDDGLEVQLEIIETAGFVRVPADRFSVFTCWEGATVSERCVASSPYVGWCLYLDPRWISELTRAAASQGETVIAGEIETFDDSMRRYSVLSGVLHDLEREEWG